VVVIALDVPSESLRGQICTWLLEIKPGVFVGDVSALVRNKIWELVENSDACKGAVLAYSSDSAQGYSIQLHGQPKRTVINFDDVQLIKIVK